MNTLSPRFPYPLRPDKNRLIAPGQLFLQWELVMTPVIFSMYFLRTELPLLGKVANATFYGGG
jgi:hypothetical protein